MVWGAQGEGQASLKSATVALFTVVYSFVYWNPKSPCNHYAAMGYGGEGDRREWLKTAIVSS